VAGELLQELSKLGESDQAVVKQQCEEYLQNLQVCLHFWRGNAPNMLTMCPFHADVNGSPFLG